MTKGDRGMINAKRKKKKKKKLAEEKLA